MGPEQAADRRVSDLLRASPLEEAVTADPPHHNPRLELRCLGCGYGAISAELIRCPMCGDEAWDFAEWRPFSH
jgi:rubrerythrin